MGQYIVLCMTVFTHKSRNVLCRVELDRISARGVVKRWLITLPRVQSVVNQNLRSTQYAQ